MDNDGYLDGYPAAPGSKGSDGTSQDAADEMLPHVGRLRRIAMQTLAELGEATPIEAATASGVAKEALQPRFSECRELGYVEPTGARRRNPSGKCAAVLRLTDKGRAAL